MENQLKILALNVKRMACLVILSNLFIKNIGAMDIKLPPDPGPKNDETLLGIDSNNNKVRDDVEIFIWNQLTKDPKTYMAYLKFAETDCEQIKYVNNLKQLEFLNVQEDNDLSCLSHFEKEIKISENSRALYKKIYNTQARKAAIKEISRKYNSFAKAIKVYPPEERLKLCRF